MENTKIIPAVLATSQQELQSQLATVTPLTKEIYIDYADGKFADGKTLDWQELIDIPQGYLENKFSLHIMAQNPLPIAIQASDSGYKIITLHIEAISENDIHDLDELAMGPQVFLAVKPDTKVEKLEPFFDIISGITIMTVVLGAQGRGFIAKALSKIKEIQELGFLGEIEVDGGINLETIDEVISAGAQRLVVGSALTKAKNPRDALNKLTERINNGY